jgi:formylglycine-generating enzyme required for sulfatase activity
MVMAGTKFENYFYWGGSRGVVDGALNSNNCSSVVGCDDWLPVEYITWYMAAAFCNKLSQRVGLTEAYAMDGNTDIIGLLPNEGRGGTITLNTNANGYRLPMKDEWEYAARGCKGGSCENFKFSGSNDPNEIGWNAWNSNGAPHIVGQKKPNGLGIYDMSGNVAEWCWEREPNSASVFRGGSASGAPTTSWVRNAYYGTDAAHSRYNTLGFRVVLP